jgi:hypothetical protein
VLKSDHGHVVRGDETLKGWKIMAKILRSVSKTSLTPKFDARVAQAIKAGHKVKVNETPTPNYPVDRSATIVGGDWDTYSLARSCVAQGTSVEMFLPNTKMVKRLGL